MAPITFEQALEGVLARATNIMVGKRRQRGTGNIVKQGPLGIIDRVQGDKLERIRRWAETRRGRQDAASRGVPVETLDRYWPIEPFNTSFADSICGDTLDAINYMAMLVMLEEGTWELPMEHEVEAWRAAHGPPPKTAESGDARPLQSEGGILAKERGFAASEAADGGRPRMAAPWSSESIIALTEESRQ